MKKAAFARDLSSVTTLDTPLCRQSTAQHVSRKLRMRFSQPVVDELLN
jgi:hypothetical protein